MDSSKAPAIIVARNFSTALGVVRSLGEKGHCVYFVGGAYKKGALIYASVSKYIKKFTEIVSPNGDIKHEEDIINAILTYAEKLPRNTVVFPTDDFTAETVEKHRAKLEKYFILPHIAEGAMYPIIKLMDKTNQHILAKQSGLNTPKEWEFESIEKIPNDIIYPCICKPYKSNAGHKDEIKVCLNEEELKNHLEFLVSDLGRSENFLVQQYLDVDYEIDISGVCNDQNIILPGVIFKHIVAQKQMGVSLAGELCKTDLVGSAYGNIMAFLKSLHLVGMFDLELMVSGGEIYFNEINLRCGGPCYSYTAGGVNLPHILVEILANQDSFGEESHDLSFGKRFIYEKVAFEDFISGFLPYIALKQLKKNSDIFLLRNKKDPLPYLVFSVRKLVQNVLRCVKSPKKQIFQVGERAYTYYMSHRLKNPIKSDGEVCIVVGNNYNVNYSVARSLGEEGCCVKVIELFDTNLIHTLMRHFILPQPCAFSKYVSDYIVCILGKDSHKAESNLISLLSTLGSINNPPCLIPTDDRALEIIDRNYDKLSLSFLTPNVDNKKGGFNELMDKSVQNAIAGEVGLLVPQEWIIELNESIVLPENIIFPCICKPLKSASGAKAEIKICYDKETLVSHLNLLHSGKTKKVLVQQFIKSDYEIDMSGICMNGKVLLPGIIKKTAVSKASVGVTTSGVMCSPNILGETEEKIKAFLRKMNIKGIFDLECLVSGEKIYFIEVNFRTGAPIYSYTFAGLNIPKMLVDSLKKGDSVFNGDEKVKTDISLVSERSLLEEFKSGNMSLKEVISTVKESDVCFIKNPKDKRPFRKFRLFFGTNYILRLIKTK